MMTKAQLKLFQSFAQQKYRKEHNVYVVEGDKNAVEWINMNAPILKVVATKEWLIANSELVWNKSFEVIEAEVFEMEKITLLTNPSPVYVLVEMPNKKEEIFLPENEWVLCLDQIRDPGNMGTLIRTADWFGIKTIICSEGTVDAYSPKVVQASMGSLLRVKILTKNLHTYFEENKQPVYITHLKGENIHGLKDIQPGVIVMGNESKGVAEDLLKYAHQKVFIPRFGGAESLNVAVAAGIVCSHLIH